MLFRKKIRFTLLLVGLVVSGLFISLMPAWSLTLRIGHILAPTSLQNRALVEVFKPYVEERTGGAIKVEVYPAEQLGHAPDQVEGVRIGTQAMFLGDKTWWEAFVPKVGVGSVPFLFDDREHFHRWIDEVFKPELEPQIIKNANQRFISLEVKWHRGPFKVICSKRPIFTPEDIRGLDLRLWPARMIQRSWAGLGAVIHTIDFAEAYMALKQGVVDAITSPLDLVWPQKFTEVCKYVTELRQIPLVEFISINEDIWQSLTKEQQQILVEAANEAGRWFNRQNETQVEETIEKLIREHNVAYIKVNRQSFVNVFRQKVVPDLISAGLLKEEWVKEIEALR